MAGGDVRRWPERNHPDAIIEELYVGLTRGRGREADAFRSRRVEGIRASGSVLSRKRESPLAEEWAVQGSNLRPPACKAGALTS